ncbi:hypothetical protein Pmani_018423 [Petrolisthes manimaculis]|uniref:C2H2-type domain-containing protein n=1 Tax=Petrolisthes manimaculis TaxID=1843537 RepID=A0AAE1PLI6_9EUCA|nr:hypothetical protein Pmani_018423 [Petrolisthes manimaculis]
MQDSWWEKKSDEVQYYADRNSSKEFFTSLKVVYGPQRPSTTPLLAADSTILLKDKDSITQRWKEHFSTLLNRPSTVDPSGLDAIPEKPALEKLDFPPSLEEISRGGKHTTSGKAPGMDGIPDEFYKAAGPVALDTFHGTLSGDRSAWHSRTSKAQEVFETNRRDQLANARETRKAAKSSLSATAAFQCPYCPRVCASGIGLSSHTRAHKRRLSAR